MQHAPQAICHKATRDQPAAGARRARGFIEILGDAPNNGPENPPAVQRKPRREIKEPQKEIGSSKIRSQCRNLVIERENDTETKEHPSQYKTGDGAGNRNIEFLNGFGRIFADARQAAKNKQRNRNNANLVIPRDYAVRKLVKEHGAEEQQAGKRAHYPSLRVRPLRILLRERRGKRIGQQAKNKQPAGIHKDGDTENFPDLQAASHNIWLSSRFDS